VNFTRNIGSSVGTSIVTTMIVRRSQLHQSNLVPNVKMGNARVRDTLGGMTQQLIHAGLSPYEAHRQALARMYLGVQAQSATLAYIDTYWVLGIAALAMFFLSFVLKKNNPNAKRGSTAAH
jgi:DHA2 family multidrug resistance protein